jgi:5-methylcytosine-specific restriction endonuclease McrA
MSPVWTTFSYLVHELNRSDDAAAKRIHAARAAHRFPALFEALADGRLHLSAVVMLAPHLTEETAEELIAAATRKTKSEIEQLLADRFPKPDVPTLLQALPPSSSTSSPEQHAPGHTGDQPATMTAHPHAPGHIESTGSRAKVKPLAPQRYALQVTLDQQTHDDLRHAQALLSHRLPSGDVARVIGLALKALIHELEKRKFAATDRPRKGASCSTPGSRHIPAHIRRAVWQRDGGQCTFVSAKGQRCPARHYLEFDHMDEVARGGVATVSRVRLRCRAHNQYEAERTFGAEFMENKRRAAAEASAAVRAQAEAAARAQAAVAEVIPWLRRLGFRADEARQAAAFCETIPDAPLEERVRRALSFFHAKPARAVHAMARSGPMEAAPAGLVT